MVCAAPISRRSEAPQRFWLPSLWRPRGSRRETPAESIRFSPCGRSDVRAAFVASLRRAGGEVLEAGELAEERQADDACRSVALLADDQLRDSLRVARRRVLVGVLILAVDEDHDVGVLLEGARFAEVRELRAMIGARFGRAT